MRYSYSVLSATALFSSSLAAYVPSEPWSTLTPDSPAPSGAVTDYTQVFGIAINTISSASATPTSIAKRDEINQIGDGQIQAQSGTLSTPSPTPTSVAAVINQIGDGQIQHQTTASSVAIINQIGDGQIQHQTTATPTASVINQIGDGQIQHQTSSIPVASQITDGQIQATGSPAASTDSVIPQACLGETSLAMHLNGSQLIDSRGRIGSIVANRQFQFDGPPPQAGAIYAAGWSVTTDGKLALGNQTDFYQCLSGDFYNLYDQYIGAQCVQVTFDLVDLVSC